MEETRVNGVFLPGVRLPEQIRAVDTFEAALAGADMVIGAMPSHVAREVYTLMLPWLAPGVKIVSATKGLEERTLLRMSQVIGSVVRPDAKIAVLSGPTFAPEVAEGNPTAVVVASDSESLVDETQRRFSGPTFRVYGSADVAGVEIGGALKNVIAIGAGISDGLGLGHNAAAALMTRGLAEITRLAVAAGARAETLAGLAGLGDLVLTCTGDLSRNRQVGLKLASGLRLGQILESTQTVAEGVKTTSAALELAARYGVDLPITREMHAVLHLGRAPGDAIRNLMTRTLRSEARN